METSMRSTTFRRLLASTAAASALVAGPAFLSAAQAQTYPSKSINYILPFNAGGESDISARYQQAVFKSGVLRSTIKKPGAGDSIG